MGYMVQSQIDSLVQSQGRYGTDVIFVPGIVARGLVPGGGPRGRTT